MDINDNSKKPANIYALVGKKQSGKNTVAKIWQLLDFYYKMGKDYWVKFASIENSIKNYTDIQYVLENLQFENKNSSWKQKSFAHKIKQITCILLGCKIEDFENEEFKNSKLPEEWKVWEIEYKNYNDGITHSKLSPTKEEAIFEFNRLDNRDLIVEQPYEYLPTYREVLQHIGTDLFRNQLHPGIWVNALFSNYKPIHYGENLNPFATNEENSKHITHTIYPNWIITDVRFSNELQSIKDRGGITIRVNRLIGKEVYIIENEQPFENWYGVVESYNGNGFYNVVNKVDDVILVHKNQITLQDEHHSETALDNAKFDYVINNNGTIDELIVKVKEILIKENIIWFTNQF